MQWPGGSVQVGYGPSSSVSFDETGKVITPRELRIQGLVNEGTTKLFDPVSQKSYVHNVSRRSNFKILRQTEDVGGIPHELLISLDTESSCLLAPNLFDPTIGRRIDIVHDQLIYGDDFYLTNATTGSCLNLCSPIMQFDNGVCRTKKGLAAVDTINSKAEYFVDGEFSDARRLGNKVIYTSRDHVHVNDLDHDAISTYDYPKLSYSHWRRAFLLPDPNLAVMCNKYNISTLDFRIGKPVNQVNYADRINEIRCAQVVDNYLFVLSKNLITWYRASDLLPLMTIDNSIANSDYTVDMFVSKWDGDASLDNHNAKTNDMLLSITSQLSPLTQSIVLNSTGLVSCGSDTIITESWPNIIPQCHLTAFFDDKVELYSVGNSGGLYKQDLRLYADGMVDDCIDIPPPDAPVFSNLKKSHRIGEKYMYEDYDLMHTWRNSDINDFSKIYTLIFEDTENETNPTSSSSNNNNGNTKSTPDPDLELDLDPSLLTQGFLNTNQTLRETLQSVYIKPMESKMKHHDVASEVLETRKKSIDEIIRDLSEMSRVNTRDSTDVKIKLKRDIEKISKKYPILTPNMDSELTQDSMPSQDISSSQGMWTQASQGTQASQYSQPTQRDSQASQSTQPTFSQPVVPKLGKSKKKVKKVKKKSVF